ncbi:MAG: hypothetical protein R6V85_04490 [Polyangia bacterium]
MPDAAFEAWIADLAPLLEAVAEWDQRALLFAGRIRRETPELASAVFSRMVAAAFSRRSDADRITLESGLLANLKNQWTLEHRRHAREAAAAFEQTLTLEFLVLPAEIDYSEDERDAPDYGLGRPLTLGERRALATRPSRRIIERAMLDPHPMVARRLLSNPKLTENDAVRIAAGQGSPAALLAEVAGHPRWRRSRRVSFSLISNPVLPHAHGVSLLPALPLHDVLAIRDDQRLSDGTRGASEALIESRKPLLQASGSAFRCH